MPPNTRLAFRRRALLDAGPLHLHPTLDRGLVGLPSQAFGFPGAPAECAQRPTDMVGVVTDAELAASNVGHDFQCRRPRSQSGRLAPRARAPSSFRRTSGHSARTME